MIQQKLELKIIKIFVIGIIVLALALLYKGSKQHITAHTDHHDIFC